MVKFQSLSICGFCSFLLWTFSTANQGARLLDEWNQDPTRVSNRFQCDNLCRQLKSCGLAVYSYQERTCLAKYSTGHVIPDFQDLYSVAVAARSICLDCTDDETCIPVSEAQSSLCFSRDSSQETVKSTTVTVSTSNSTTTSSASSVSTLDITTLRLASSTPSTTAAPPAPLTTSSTADSTSQSLTSTAITSETSPPSTSTTRVPTTTRLTSESTSTSSTAGTSSTPIPTTDTSTVAMSTTTPEPCPLGAALLTSEPVCVKVFTPTRQWLTARTFCTGESFNSNTYRMITFKTRQKYNEIIAHLIQKNTSAVGIWVDLIHRSGAWRWENNTVAQDLPWDPTEPNSISETCGVIYKPTHWSLHNNHCTAQWSAMCEVSAR
ncbi:uncharacterized protein [Haliotis asinina]|uniref:uncharacterized protein n=1 Tax=Haliotis asinina TaxID=109174 RepID=UPI00353242D7